MHASGTLMRGKSTTCRKRLIKLVVYDRYRVEDPFKTEPAIGKS